MQDPRIGSSSTPSTESDTSLSCRRLYCSLEVAAQITAIILLTWGVYSGSSATRFVAGCLVPFQATWQHAVEGLLLLAASLVLAVMASIASRRHSLNTWAFGVHLLIVSSALLVLPAVLSGAALTPGDQAAQEECGRSGFEVQWIAYALTYLPLAIVAITYWASRRASPPKVAFVVTTGVIGMAALTLGVLTTAASATLP